LTILFLFGLSAELLAGWGKAAPNEGGSSNTPYGYIYYGYKVWTSFFAQASYVKGFVLGLEPYIRLNYSDHEAYQVTIIYNNTKIGTLLNEDITSYEIGLSRPIRRPPFHFYGGGAFSGNFCRWQRQAYGATDIKTIDQVTPGTVVFLRGEYWRKYRPWPDEETTVNLILGLSARFSYMGFRPDAWPCPDWFGELVGYVGVRW
jgi:hypothetical protein